MTEKSGHKIKLFKTAMLIFTWFAVGFNASLIGATMPDLRTRFSTDAAGLSYAMSFGQAGAMIGAPLSSLLDRFGEHFDVIFWALQSVMACVAAVRPSSTFLWLFGVCDFIHELCWIMITAGGSSIVLGIWGADSAPYLQAVQLGYPIGSTIGPLVAGLFVSQNNSDSNTTVTVPKRHSVYQADTLGVDLVLGHHEPSNADTTSNDRYPDESTIEYAFYIGALLLLTASIPFLCMYFCCTTTTVHVKKSSYGWRDIFSPSKWTDGVPRLGVGMLLCMMVFFICYNNQANCISIYVTTYASDSDLGFSNQEAATLGSLLNFTGSVSRLFAIFISNFISVNYLFSIHVNGSLVAILLLTIFGPQSKTNLYVFVAVYGFMFRPLRGYNYSFLSLYMTMIAIIFGINALAGNFASVFLQSLVGYLYDATVIEVIFYLATIYGFIYTVVYFWMLLLGRKYGTKEERKAKSSKSGKTELSTNNVLDYDCISSISIHSGMKAAISGIDSVIFDKQNFTNLDTECTHL